MTNVSVSELRPSDTVMKWLPAELGRGPAKDMIKEPLRSLVVVKEAMPLPLLLML